MGRRTKPLKHGSIRGASLQVRSARTRSAGLVLLAIDSQSRQLAASVPCVSNEVRGKAQQPRRVRARVGMRSSVLLGRGPYCSFGQCITNLAPRGPWLLAMGRNGAPPQRYKRDTPCGGTLFLYGRAPNRARKGLCDAPLAGWLLSAMLWHGFSTNDTGLTPLRLFVG